MRTILIAAPLLALSAPAVAGDPYVELGAGVVDARANDVDQTIDYSTTQAPSSPGVAGPADTFVDDVFGTRSKQGHELSVAAGYDFGWFRLEGELNRGQVRTSRIAADDATEDFLGQLNAGLNRPSAAPNPGAPGLGAVTLADFQRGGHIRQTSAMANAIVDAKVARRLTLFAGLGVGRSWVSGFGDKDSARAWQYTAGLRFPVGDRLELGIKHRYFDSGIVTLVEAPRDFAGNPDRTVVNGTTVDRTTNASVSQDLEGSFRTRSVQLTLGYRF